MTPTPQLIEYLSSLPVVVPLDHVQLAADAIEAVEHRRPGEIFRWQDRGLPAPRILTAGEIVRKYKLYRFVDRKA